MNIKKSFIHFIDLVKKGQFQDISRIGKYYFLDKVLRRIFIFIVKLDGVIAPPKRLHKCPSCEKIFPYFYPAVCGDHIAFNTQCPHCKSYERHRAQWLYYCRETNLFSSNSPICVLHCAPEERFFKKLYKKKNVDYYPIDKWKGFTVCGKKMRDYVDLVDLPYEDNTFDYILCNHVLEHIPDEQAALLELKRVLKPGGCAFLNVPIDPTINDTLENPAYNTDSLRLKHYGQCDHVRKYGLDYKNHLEKAGFLVAYVVVKEYFSKEEIYKYGLLPNDRIYYCKKR